METVSDYINTDIYNDIFAYIQSKVSDGPELIKDWLSDNQWVSLIPMISESPSFNKIILKSINLLIFDINQIILQWSNFTQTQKKLVWIWYKLNKNTSYCCSVFNQNSDLSSILQELRDYILTHLNQDWLIERNEILTNIKDIEYDVDYFQTLDTLDDKKDKLSLLTYSTHEERTYALKIISEILNNGIDIEPYKEIFANNFNDFAVYYFNNITDHQEIDNYFSWYKYNKLLNNYTKSEEPIVNYSMINSRYSILKKYDSPDNLMLWVDGMGIEYLPLLLAHLHSLSDDNVAILKSQVVYSNLPTETEYNTQWDSFNCHHIKLDKLDVLNHKGMPDDKDYFSCIDNQFIIISEVARIAISKVKNYNELIITSDHGSSRLAALAFHKSAAYTPPKKTKSKSFGRYCEFEDSNTVIESLPFADIVLNSDKKYLIVSNHEHFTFSGIAVGKNEKGQMLCGEIHGGQTPEEYLVPIIILKNKSYKNEVTYELELDNIYIKNGEVTLNIKFNKKIVELQIKIGGNIAECKNTIANEWSVVFRELQKGHYATTVLANNNILSKNLEFTVVQKGIKENDLVGDF
jgi:hypothetical protein